jgi:hypothetical protein
MSIRKIGLDILRIFIIIILALSLNGNSTGVFKYMIFDPSQDANAESGFESMRFDQNTSGNAASHLALDVSSYPSGAWIYFDNVNTSLKTNSSFEPPITKPGSHKLMFISENHEKIGGEIPFNSSLEKIEANFLYKILLISFNMAGRTTCLKIDTI